ncbi:MAG: hypothetical protein NTZ49_01845 [Candidatus Parcubacteria bacterium]|nr:hypothetical protein [Candidatus Parcubacteria bacterium]
MPEFKHLKSEEEFENQALKFKKGVPFDIAEEDYKLTPAQLKEKYPVEYNIYVEELRALKQEEEVLDKYIKDNKGKNTRDIISGLIWKIRPIVIINNLDKLEGHAHQEIALLLIKAGRSKDVAANLEEFKGLDYQKIVWAMFEYGGGEFVADYLEKFKGIDHKEVATKLIDSGKGRSLAQNLGKFIGLDHQEIASELIKRGEGENVANYLGNFRGLNHKEIAIELINNNKAEDVVRRIEAFDPASHKQILLALLNVRGGKTYIAEKGYLRRFHELDNETALKLIKEGLEIPVAENPDIFNGVNYQQVAEALIMQDNVSSSLVGSSALVRNLKKFKELDYKKIALMLFEQGKGFMVVRYLEDFKDLDREIALKIIEVADGPHALIFNLGIFIGLDHKEIVLKIIEANRADLVARFLGKFNNLDKVVAFKLIEAGQSAAVVIHLEKFSDIDPAEIADKIIEVGEGYTVATLIDRFPGLNNKAMAIRLIANGQGKAVADNLTKFEGMDKDVALAFINANLPEVLSFEFDYFKGLDNEVAIALIIKNFETTVLDNLHKFVDLDHRMIALALIHNGMGPAVADDLEKFTGLKGGDYQLILEALLAEMPSADKVVKFCQEKKVSLNLEKYNYYKDLGLEHKEFWEINEHYDELSKLNKKNRVNKVAEFLLNNPGYIWDREICAWFKELASLIGTENAWKYIKGSDRHDALYFLPDLFQIVTNKEELKNILLQTASDSAVSIEGMDSRQLLVNAVKNFQPGWREEFEKEGWFKNVKTFRKKVELRRKMTPRMQEALNNLQESNPKLYEYANKLIAHPTVGMGPALMLFTDAERFLQLPDSHANKKLQSELEPNQWAELGDGYYTIALRPEDIVKALVEGQIDTMSPFKPYSKDYTMILKNKEARDKEKELDHLAKQIEGNLEKFITVYLADSNQYLSADLNKSLEVFKIIENLDFEELKKYTQERAAGLVSGKKFGDNSEALLEQITQIKDKDDLKKVWRQILESKDIKAEFLAKKIKSKREKFEVKNLIPEEQKILIEDMKAVIEDHRLKYSGEEIIMRAEILPHSDPRYATIGDDTSCCMPFGSGKQNVYLFSPQCGAMTLSFRQPGQSPEEARIVVQSIMTLDKGIGKEKFEKLVTDLRLHGEVNLQETLGPDFLEKFYNSQNVIACDNVEGQNNLVQRLIKNDESIISVIYKAFFDEYRKQLGMENSRVVIGLGYLDYLKNIKTTPPNEFLPQALISYSDNLHDKCLELLPEGAPKDSAKRIGIQDISWRDTFPVAYLEEKIYGSNPALVEGITTMQKILTASNLQAEQEKTNALTLGHFTDAGVLDGYVLGYLAKEPGRDETKIYFHDIAVDPDKQKTGVGMELAWGLMKKIENDDKLNKMPIVMRCRETTSYPIIMKYAGQYNYEIAVDTKMKEAGETFHRLELRKIKK